MARRIFLCLAAAAACCCLFCLALLPPLPPAQRRRPGGLQQAEAAAGAGGGGLGRRSRLLHLLPVPQPHFDHATEAEEEEQRGVPVRKARPAWSSAAAAGSVRPELRAVPGGPDPLHHHGGSPSRRPEQDRTTSP